MVKIRLSERFTKETIKRVQKKFTFYAECEFLRPLGQIYLSKSKRQQTESNQTCLNCRGAEEEDDSQREYLINFASEIRKTSEIRGDFQA